MTVMSVPILTFLIFFPLLGAVLLLFVDRKSTLFIKVFTLVFSIAEFGISLPLFFIFDEKAKGMQFMEKVSWLVSSARVKEIGIRKVNGARVSEVIVLLNKMFLQWVAIAFVVATPVSWFALQNQSELVDFCLGRFAGVGNCAPNRKLAKLEICHKESG